MPRLAYDVVDVFCDRSFTGNPLAVVHGADGLSGGQLQALAREFNLSETTFPVPRDPAGYDVRIFTPADEIPFAGHPTIGTAWLLRRRGELTAGDVVQQCGAGPVDVTVTDEGAQLTTRPRFVTDPSDPSDASALAAGVGLGPQDVVGGSRVASCGLGWTYLRVRPDAVVRARPGAGLAVPAVGADPMGGLCVFAVEAAAGGALSVHTRVFSPDDGIVEDPATGSAAVALGAVLVADGLADPDGSTAYEIAQGAEIGRPSVLSAGVDASGGAALRVRVGGGVAHTASGTIEVPAAS
jgi:trans-2,3-dihydro-3-hydroxyanthranilate isomerase